MMENNPLPLLSRLEPLYLQIVRHRIVRMGGAERLERAFDLCDVPNELGTAVGCYGTNRFVLVVVQPNLVLDDLATSVKPIFALCFRAVVHPAYGLHSAEEFVI